MNTETTKHKRYDEAFKRSAVEHWMLSGRSATQIAGELGFISFEHGSLTTLSSSGVTYDITSLTLVPEPAVSSLFCGGICLLWLRRKSARGEG